jgi:hypothetical protein
MGGTSTEMPIFRFKSNAGDILKKAWSIWLWGLGFLFIILDTAMPFFQMFLPEWFPLWAFGVASGVCAVGGMLARVLIQDNLHG